MEKTTNQFNLKNFLKSYFTMPLITTGLITLLWFLAQAKIERDIEFSVQKEMADYTNNLQKEAELRTRAEKIAEYLALYTTLKPSSPTEDYKKANQMAFELALWLPDTVYLEVGKAVVLNDSTHNQLTALLAVRKILLGNKAGSISPDSMFSHFPNAKKLLDSIKHK